MKVGLVITVKNEERLLRQNLLYHLAIGIEQVFVYFDGTTDRGKELIYDLKGVQINDSVRADKFKHLSYLQHLCQNADKMHTARQCLNTYDAQLKCRDLGIQWLISLDCDELFLADYSEPISLSEFLGPLKSFDVIQMQTFEVLCKKMAYSKVMLEETEFKLKKNFKNHFNRIYFSFYNPYDKKSINHSYWLGHNMGKLVIRVDANIIPKNVHRYQTINGTQIKSVNKGFLLHYHIYDFEDFIKKYKNFKSRPKTYLSGNPIGTLKKLWMRMVNDEQFNELYLKEYFKKHILIDKKKYRQLNHLRYLPFVKRITPTIVRVTQPKKILESIKSL